jgi:hypothetical protein
MAMTKKRAPLSKHLDMYEESWKPEHEDVKNQLWHFEDQLCVGLALYKSVVHNSYWAWFERVERGSESYDLARENEHKQLFVQWAGVCEIVIQRLNSLEVVYGTVDGGRNLRATFREAQSILENWDSPKLLLRVPSQAAKSRSAADLAEELNKISHPTDDKTVHLKYKTDYDKVF